MEFGSLLWIFFRLEEHEKIARLIPHYNVQ